MRGHSFLPNDQDFSIIAKKKRKVCVETPEEWNDIISSCRSQPNSFKVTRMHHQDFHNVKEAVQKYFRKSSGNEMKLKGLRMYRIDRESPFIGVRDSYSGAWRSVNIRNRSAIPQELSFPQMCNVPPKINYSKMQDLRKLYGLLRPSNRQFFETLVQEKGTNIHGDVDIDNSDNGSGEDNY
ncbi:hypothetical protein ANN_19456 [Periplaneta americana]|uniref:Uncharacterized protein n=1 Tax=Periplaneta americana TaxID=6978 RepID=A0ABQ8SAK5_PERAM|nr:hypothetical protein ANN_19456 [Periplaneta americana]